jgi:5'(3')-deoxyribonucleotidase
MSLREKSIVYVDMDDVLCDFSGAYKEHLQLHPHIKFPQSTPGFFEGLLPIEGAIEATNFMRSTESFELYILTAPSTRNPLSYTEKRLWIENHFDYEFTERLIICPNKGLLRGDYLIDDNLHGKGQENFLGTVLHYGSPCFPSWRSILSYLNSLQENNDCTAKSMGLRKD